MSKKRFWWILLAVALLVSVWTVSAFAVNEPTLDIQNRSISLDSAIYMNFKVVPTNVAKENISLLIWTKPQTSYTKGTEETVLLSGGTDSKGREVFVYTNIDSRKMTDVIYARAYAVVNGKEIYSEPTSFSVREYAYRIGKMQGQEGLKALINDMLRYGASAQQYFNYHTDFLATDMVYEVKTVGATLSDGLTGGMYQNGSTVTVTANAPASGMEFSHFENSLHATISTENPLTYTVTKDDTLTAVYSSIIEKESQGLAYTVNPDNITCTVTDISTCTDTKLYIPRRIDGYIVTSIGSSAFEWCTGLTSVTIPNSVTSIGENAFSGCTGITSITIPNSVTNIYNGAFASCSALTTITVAPNNTTYYSENNCIIEKNTKTLICGCKTSIIPQDVTSIGVSAFYGCSNLTSITIPNSVTSIGDYAFTNCTGLPSVTIPNSVTSLGCCAFAYCTGFTSVSIPDSVTSIGARAFEWSGLTSITIPNSVTSIDGETFYGCKSLASITIPDSVISIGDYAFSVCTGLTSVTIGNSVTSIGNYAFENCTGLTSVSIPNSVTSIGENAFKHCIGLTSSIIPNSVTSIGAYAFVGCEGLLSVTIPNSVTSIGEWAFFGCTGLTSITIPNSVTSVNDSAFRGCTGLASVTVENGVTSIGEAAFSGCTSLSSVTVGNSVTSIGEWAFNDCTSLASIVIPNSVTSIGKRAFDGCTSLATVYYGGTATKWMIISIGCDNYNLTCAPRYYYFETQPTATGNLWHWVDGVPTKW